MNPVRAAGFIIYRRIQADLIEYLLMQTSYGEHHWTPPKGHVDPGENDFQAALRETQEEAGLSEEVLKIVPDFKIELRYQVRNKPKVTTYWLAELLEPKTNLVKMSEEHQDFKWLSLEEAKSLSGFTDFNQALDKCQAQINTK